MSEMFDDLSGRGLIDFLEGNSAAELRDQLRQIRLPYRIEGFYSVGGRHFVFLTPTRELIKRAVKARKAEK